MDSLIYEDTPRYDTLLKAIMVLPVFLFVFFIITGVYCLIIGEVAAAIGMFAATLLVAAYLWIIFPRKYQILDSKFRIVLGGPLHFDIPFNNLETAVEGSWIDMMHLWSLSLNFVTCYSKNIVKIVRKKGLKVNITPNNLDLFLENLNKALNDWRRYNLR